MNATQHPLTPTTMVGATADHARLHDFAERAIAASVVLTSASIAGAAISDVLYARIENTAFQSRRRLLDHLKHDHGIDAAMAEQLGAIL